jgi:hypothetical protein
MIKNKSLIEGISVKSVTVASVNAIYATYKFDSDGMVIRFDDWTVEKMNTESVTLINKYDPEKKINIKVFFEVTTE